ARAEEQFFDLTERLADLTFEQSDTLVIAAEELDLPIREIGPFSRDQGDGVASEDAFREAAFSSDVLEAGHNSALVELDQNRVVVVRVTDRQPATYLPLEDVRGRIAQELRQRGSAGMAREDGERILARIDEGTTLEELAREY